MPIPSGCLASAKRKSGRLVASLAAPTPSLPAQQITGIKQRLIEGHLGLATSIVIELCPRRCRDLFPDLVQEANLALIQATNRCDYTKSGNFTAYVAAWMRGKVKQALSDDSLIKIDYDTRKLAQQRGTLDELSALQHPLSLDCLLDERDPDSSLLDSLKSPSQPTRLVCDPQTHVQVEALLSYLSPRAQSILRLRYRLLREMNTHTPSRKSPAHSASAVLWCTRPHTMPCNACGR